VVRTHLLLLVPGLLMTGVGWYAAHQAARSTEGGIGEPLAYLPLLFGVPMLVLSIASLVVGRSKHREDPVPPPTG
jgi:TRAP-type C4-dicarboxylate transport system permease small subunit